MTPTLSTSVNKPYKKRVELAVRTVNKNKRGDNKISVASTLKELLNVWTDHILGPEKKDE